MDDAMYGERLRAARKADGRFPTQESLGDAIGRSGRQVRNYEKGRNISPEVKLLLEGVLGNFAPDGDPVEVAVRQSELTEDRQYDVIGYYKRRLREQREERAG